MNVSTKFRIVPLSCKSENTRKLPDKIGDQEMARMQQSMTKSQSDLRSTIMNVSAKFEINARADCPEMCGNYESVTDGRTDRQTDEHPD